MTAEQKPDLPLDLGRARPPSNGITQGKRGWVRWQYLLVLLVPVLMFSGGVIGMYFQPAPLQKFYGLTGLQPGGGANSPIALPPEIVLPPQMAETLLPTDVVGLARLMPRGDVAIVAAPFGASDARVAEIHVSIGQRVTRGTVVATLDNNDALAGAVLLAEANLAVRLATLAQTRSAVAASRAEAQATLDQVRAIAANAAATLERTEDLAARGVATSATLDAARTTAVEAALAISRSEATLARFSALALDDQPDVVVAARNVDAATAELTRARMDTARAEVRAPIDGVILDIQATPGQRPSASGIMDMGDTDVMMAEVEIWQDRIASVAVGQPVELAAPALGQTLRGTVDSIGLTVGRQGLISDDAAANSDARVIRVLVALDAGSSSLAARYVGLEAVARIDTNRPPR